MGVACDLGYPCAKFRLPRPFGFRVRADVRDIRQTDGQTTDADHRLMPPPPLRGGGITTTLLLSANRFTHQFIADVSKRTNEVFELCPLFHVEVQESGDLITIAVNKG